MKVGIDISPLKTGHRFRGVGFYTRYLTENLKRIEDQNFEVELIKGPKPVKVDLIHYPFFDLFFPTLSVKKDQKVVVTVHDVIPLLFPKNFPSGMKGKLNLRRQMKALNGVKAVITDSRSSQKDIVRFLSVPEENIFVVYLAAGKIFRRLERPRVERVLKKYKLPTEYIVYAGDVNFHKNLLRLARACQKIGVPLVILGKQAAEKDLDWDHSEMRLWRQVMEEFGDDPGLIRPGFLPDYDYVAILNGASAYCQPSLYEGFGLPVLEAMACGVPVACSRGGSLPEVGGQAVLYFDPEDEKQIVKVLSRILSDKKIRDKLVRKGYRQNQKFSWEKTAKETLAVYRKANE